MILIFGYILILLTLAIFSYGFIDANFFYQPPKFLHDLVYINRSYSLGIFILIILGLFGAYGKFLCDIQKNKLKNSRLWKLIFLTAGILLFAFPGFSNDIFNYIATAKITYFYRENPYIVMPLEIENEPMLAFMHASNKTALYGPSWILLTAIPHFLGFGNLVLKIFTFKLFAICFYFGLIWLVWQLTDKSKFNLAFFALNPLVIIETLMNGHNDVVMMFFALFAFYSILNNRFLISHFSFLISILIKFATVFLVPIYIYVFYNKWKNKKINWQKIWICSAVSMFIIFMLSPLREEMYSWYFIWPLAFLSLWQGAERLSLKSPKGLAFYTSAALSFGLLLRFAPFIYYREWGGITPIVKKTVTAVFPIAVLIFLLIKKYVYKIKK